MADIDILGVAVPVGAFFMLYYWLKRKHEEHGDEVKNKIAEHQRKAKLDAERVKKEREEQYTRQWKRVDELIGEHAEVLSQKRKDLSEKDDYGVDDLSNWEKEKTYFIDRIINVDSSAVSLPMNPEYLNARIDTILYHLGHNTSS